MKWRGYFVYPRWFDWRWWRQCFRMWWCGLRYNHPLRTRSKWHHERQELKYRAVVHQRCMRCDCHAYVALEYAAESEFDDDVRRDAEAALAEAWI